MNYVYKIKLKHSILFIFLTFLCFDKTNINVYVKVMARVVYNGISTNRVPLSNFCYKKMLYMSGNYSECLKYCACFQEDGFFMKKIRMYVTNKFMLYCLRDIFVSIYNGMSDGVTRITHFIPCTPTDDIKYFSGEECIFNDNLNERFNNVATHTDNLIYTGLNWLTYGDIWSMLIVPLILCPKQILYESNILFRSDCEQKLLNSLLDVFDITINFLLVDPDDYVWCERCYIIVSNYVYFNFIGLPMDIMKSAVNKKLNLGHNKALLYCLYNRPSNKNRHITNIKKLYSKLLKQHPVKWRLITFKNYTTERIFILFSQIMVLVSAVGSNLFNCLFMQCQTGVVSINFHFFDFCYRWAIHSKVFYFVIQFSHIHHRTKNVKIDVDRVLLGAKVIFYTIANKCWPQKNLIALFHSPLEANVTQIKSRESFFKWEDT